MAATKLKKKKFNVYSQDLGSVCDSEVFGQDFYSQDCLEPVVLLFYSF